jgi:hypothetical protein
MKGQIWPWTYNILQHILTEEYILTVVMMFTTLQAKPMGVFDDKKFKLKFKCKI